jgi:hypothetical protein
VIPVIIVPFVSYGIGELDDIKQLDDVDGFIVRVCLCNGVGVDLADPTCFIDAPSLILHGCAPIAKFKIGQLVLCLAFP